MTPLERGQLRLMRIHAILGALVAAAVAAVAEYILHKEVGLPRGAVALPLALPLLYAVVVSPGRRYRAWGYQLDADELQVRHGVWLQMHTLVPLDRVQHIDISQGPLERSCGVCRLVVHTAGTLHSQVVLPGLARPTAERIRDEIRARIREERE